MTESQLHFQSARYEVSTMYLKNHRGEFNRVFWSDACDVVFQSDPFVWMGNHRPAEKLIAAKEGWLIKDQPINDIWLQRLTSGGSEYQAVREQEVLCSGTILGEAVIMEELFYQISTYNDAMQGVDQGIFNLLMRRPPFVDVCCIPDIFEGFVCTCGPFFAQSDPAVWTIPAPICDKTTELISTPDGAKVFSTIHQFNRDGGVLNPDGSWRGILERKYRS